MNLRTAYLGLELKHPVVASASPLSRTLDGVRQLEDGGASAIVLYSIFEEQIRHEAAAQDHLLSAGGDSFGEALSYFPDPGDARPGPERYLEHLRRCRDAVDVPVIGSLNGVTAGGWVDYARLIEQAGAAALELNIYYLPADINESSADVEARYVDTLRAVKAAVHIPVAVKLGPYFSSFGALAQRLDEAGADALVLFNRFYQPDMDIDTLEVTPSLELSRPNEIRPGLFWMALLHGRIRASLAATSGVNSAHEVAKYLLAGADVVMTTSALLRLGADYTRSLVSGLVDWMDEKGYASLEQVRGAMSHARLKDPGAYERANYIRVLEAYAAPQWH